LYGNIKADADSVLTTNRIKFSKDAVIDAPVVAQNEMIFEFKSVVQISVCDLSASPSLALYSGSSLVCNYAENTNVSNLYIEDGVVLWQQTGSNMLTIGSIKVYLLGNNNSTINNNVVVSQNFSFATTSYNNTVFVKGDMMLSNNSVVTLNDFSALGISISGTLTIGNGVTLEYVFDSAEKRKRYVIAQASKIVGKFESVKPSDGYTASLGFEINYSEEEIFLEVPQPMKKKFPLEYIVIGVGGVVVIAGIIAVTVICMRRKKARAEERTRLINYN